MDFNYVFFSGHFTCGCTLYKKMRHFCDIGLHPLLDYNDLTHCSFNVCDYLKVSSAMKFSPESIASIHLSVKPVPGHLGSHVYGLYREIAALEGIYMFCSKLGLFFQSLTNFFNDRKN